MLIVPGLLAAIAGSAISAPDKYTLQVPNGLAFAEFKGYEDWQTVSVSLSEEAFALILANPIMIEAYRSGIPGNGKPFPDGSKMAKIHWKPEKSAEAPAPTEVAGALHDVDFMVRFKALRRQRQLGLRAVQLGRGDRRVHASGHGRRLRLRLPHHRAGEGLRLHRIPQALTSTAAPAADLSG